MKENKRIYNSDKKITRFSIRKYQGYGVTSVIIIGFIIMSSFNVANADRVNQYNNSDTHAVNNNVTLSNHIDKDAQNNNKQFEKDITSLVSSSSIKNNDLENLLNQYKAINLSDKTDDSVTLFSADLQEAETILNKPKNQQQVDQFYHKFLNSAGKLRNKNSIFTTDKTNTNQNQNLNNDYKIQNAPNIKHEKKCIII